MKVKGNWELVWVGIAMGVVLTTLIVVVAREDRDPHAQTELKSQRIALINKMRLALAAASEEQNCAVMSTNEQAAKAFIERSNVEVALFKRSRRELDNLIPKRNVEQEALLINRVDEAFSEFQSISEQLSILAPKSSNRKAYVLAFGPALELLQAMDREFARLAAEQEASQGPARMEVLRTINNARLSGLQIQVLLIPHIAEPSEQKMDELERRIAEEDQSIERGLESLAGLSNTAVDIATIKSHYMEFKAIESQIIRLSRENSDIRSVEIALNEKRKAMLACQDALVNLENAVRLEPVETTIPKGRGQ